MQKLQQHIGNVLPAMQFVKTRSQMAPLYRQFIVFPCKPQDDPSGPNLGGPPRKMKQMTTPFPHPALCRSSHPCHQQEILTNTEIWLTPPPPRWSEKLLLPNCPDPPPPPLRCFKASFGTKTWSLIECVCFFVTAVQRKLNTQRIETVETPGACRGLE